MNLTIDIGNTRTRAGIFDGKNLKKIIQFNSNKPIFLFFKKFIGRYLIKKIGISSVVPKLNDRYKKLFYKDFNLKPIFIDYSIKLPINLKVNNRKNIGSDRICNAVFGYNYFKNRENVIIISCGTAITYDIVISNGDYLGGLIAPGLYTIVKSLNQNTARLPLLKREEIKLKKNPVGKNTKSAISSGVLLTVLDSMDGIIERIKNYYRRDFKIILTGGDASFIHKKLSHKVFNKSNCVIEGINIIIKGC